MPLHGFGFPGGWAPDAPRATRTPFAWGGRMTRSTNQGALVLAFALALSLAAPRPAEAQGPVLGGTLGGVGGLVAGTTVTLGLIVANARMERDFIHGPGDIISLQGIPIVAGLAGGIWFGAAEPDRLDEASAWTGAGMTIGAGLGALIGEAVTRDDPSGKWAGGVMGAAVGVLAGVIVASQ